MNWYFKHDTTEAVAGPMTEAEAREIGDDCDGVVFSEEMIWGADVTDTEGEPVSLSAEVEDLLEYLRGLKDGEDDTLSAQCDRIIDALVLLSEKARLTDDTLSAQCNRIIDALVLLSGKARLTDTLSAQCDRIIDALVLLSGKARLTDVDVASLMSDLEKVLVGDLRERTIQAILDLSAKKIVTGSIDAGVLEIDEVSPGVEVFINDYDIQELDDDRISEDDDGRECLKLEFG